MNRFHESKVSILLFICAMLSLHLCFPLQSEGPSALEASPEVQAQGVLALQSSQPAEIFKRGVEALQAGKLDDAERDLKSVIRLDPKSSAAHVNLAVVYMRTRHWSEAKAQLQIADTLSPGQAGIQLNLGLVYYKQGDFASAILPLRNALQIAPSSRQTRYLLGLCYFFTNKYTDASTILKPLWPVEEDNLNYLYVVSIAASKAADAELQAAAFKQMITIGQDRPEFHLYLGKAWLAQDNTSNALSEFQSAQAAAPNLPLVHYFLGRTYLKEHEYRHAETEFLRDISLEPEIASNYEDLGTVYAQLNEEEKAAHYYRLALERDPSLVNSYIGLSKLDRKTGDNEEALSLLNRAVSLSPQSASVHYMRAQVLAKLHHSSEASREFAVASRLLESFNNGLQQDLSGDHFTDAQSAAQ